MTARSGLGASIGFGDEVTWGTAVAPTVWVPFRDESIGQEIARMESDAIIAGQRVARLWAPGAVTATGDVGFDLNDQSKGLLLKHMFGGASTTGPFSPADLAGLGMTVQVGVPDVDTGTPRPKTLAGAKVASWEVRLTAGEIVSLGLSLVGRHVLHHRTVVDGVTTNASASITSATASFSQDDVGKPISGTGIPAAATILSVESTTAATLSANATASGTGVTFTFGMALTSPSYASNLLPMSFVHGTVTIGGTATKLREITLAGDDGLADDRLFAGQATNDEPLEQQLREYTGSIETDYFNDTMYRRFLSGAEASLVLTVARGTKSIIFTGNARFDGESPKVGGRGIVGQSQPFKLIGTTTDASALTVTLDET